MTAVIDLPPAELRDCPAPAKLNLFLHVTGRRPDGYRSRPGVVAAPRQTHTRYWEPSRLVTHTWIALSL